MPLDFNPDYLDRYFKNQLSDTDRQIMEQLIAQDPLLKSEMHFQREVVEAICQRRKWELKARLNALAPESSPLFTIPRLAFGSTLTIAGLLTATLFWFDSKKIAQAPERQAKPVVKQIQEKNKPEIVQTKPVQAKPIQVKPIQTNYVTRIELPVAAPTQKATVVKEEPCLPNTQDIVQVDVMAQDMAIKAYDESLLFEISNTDTDNGVFDRYSEDENNLERTALSQMLRYQYYHGRLSLYNNTSAGKQIHTEIEGELRYFLYYENVYYEFFDEQTSEAIMSPLRDKNVLVILKQMIAQMEHIK